MTAQQVYEQSIKPLSNREKLDIARLIIEDVGTGFPAETPVADSGYAYLKRILPQIERITVTDQDLAGIVLDVEGGRSGAVSVDTVGWLKGRPLDRKLGEQTFCAS